MARKGDQYSDKKLAKIYRQYADRKGWSTRDEVVQDKVESWRDSMIGPVGLAIDWYENGGKDPKPELGKDATIAKGCRGLSGVIVAALLIIVLLVVLIAVSS